MSQHRLFRFNATAEYVLKYFFSLNTILLVYLVNPLAVKHDIYFANYKSLLLSTDVTPSSPSLINWREDGHGTDLHEEGLGHTHDAFKASSEAQTCDYAE